MSWCLMACPACGTPAKIVDELWAASPYWSTQCAHAATPLRMTLDDARERFQRQAERHEHLRHIADCAGRPI